LIPTPLCAVNPLRVLPPITIEVIYSLSIFFVENAKTARAFLREVEHPLPIKEVTFYSFDKHANPKEEVREILVKLKNNNVSSCGVLSEAGYPCVADPGSILINEAHCMNMKVIPLIGPSSLILALVASGLPGQQFTFHGYFPHENSARIKLFDYIEGTRLHTHQFIETPYRTLSRFQSLMLELKPTTLLSIASNLTSSSEKIFTQSVKNWKKNSLENNDSTKLNGGFFLPHKEPTIFSIACM
jgi:16S rRNA (cytidine1402-2'-O)-methyltransferase